MKSSIYSYRLTVPLTAVDANNHANNVEYIRWMQDAAVGHSNEIGATAEAANQGGTWYVRSHHIDYFRPAQVNEVINVLTWVADFRKSSSLRKYKIIRDKDGAVLAEANTIWVFVNAETGRPQSIPETIRDLFGVLSEQDEP